MEPILRVTDLSKSFGTLPVVKQISFDVQPGEVIGLTGSIGSGKSVLAMLLAGIYQPDAGEITFANKRLTWPFSAQSLGIGVIHQKPTLEDKFDVVSNVFLGNEIGWPRGLGSLRVLDTQRMQREAERILKHLGVQVTSLHDCVANLSGEQRQMIAIARVLTLQPRMIILDEPTVLLGYSYQQRLLGLIQDWREQGVAVIFSGNNIDHLFAVTDRIIILNQGRKVADLQTDGATRESLVGLLLGVTDVQKPTPAIWDIDRYDDIREQTERLRYHQTLLGKEMASEPTLNRQLTEQMAEQVQTLDQINLTLLETHRRLISEREQERKQVARDLHDQIIQDLLSINYELEGMETERDVSPTMVDNLSEVRQGIRDLVENLRAICADLRPLTIDSLGLGAAIKSHTRDWSTRTGIKVEISLDEHLGRLPEATELSIFRIIQEGLNNVWRHAQATCVQIRLEHTSPRALVVSLRDNGIGINKEIDLGEMAHQGHYGLVGISERVTLLGGRFRMQRHPEGGSVLIAEIPHPRIEPISDMAE